MGTGSALHGKNTPRKAGSVANPIEIAPSRRKRLGVRFFQNRIEKLVDRFPFGPQAFVCGGEIKPPDEIA